MSDVQLTHIGGPTVLIQTASWSILVDPTFDTAGRRYSTGWGTSTRKIVDPSMLIADLPSIDAVLLTHDNHADNLDDAGRALLPSVDTVVTTVPAAGRLGGNSRGLNAWATTRLEKQGSPSIDITATPCRHGPPGSRPIVGHVIGFALQWEGQQNGQLWVSGDTVLYDGVRQVAERLDVGTVLLHLGGVKFPVTGPFRYTMTAADGVELLSLIQPNLAIPVHYEGWSHFQERRETMQRAFDAAPTEVKARIEWLPIGTTTAVDV